ncbi:hypothetical protein H072_3349 [Dactylellina haptotyla CBS 200.50]|uniref:RGS domain-containing protein n=1 Tax=Dactylellina haptotyla (strain CBS 200.50) TaxID=1284197 RepID=S8AIJ4_DACHA|nr:hypothetical protein H072_3349 [Dactylellina haptotyla CBS 200.50]
MPDTTVLPVPSGSCDSPSADGGSSLATSSPTNNDSIPISSPLLPPETNYNNNNNNGEDDREEDGIVIEQLELEAGPETRCNRGVNRNRLQILAIPNPSNSTSQSLRTTPVAESCPASPISRSHDIQDFPDITPTASFVSKSALTNPIPVKNHSNSGSVARGASTSYYSTLAQRQIKNLSNATLPPCFTTIEGPISIHNNQQYHPPSNSKENSSSTNGHSSNRASISYSSVNPLLSLANLARAVSGAPTNPQNGSSDTSTTTPSNTNSLGRKKTLSSRRKSDGGLLKSSSYDNLDNLNQRYPAGLTLAEVLETTGNHSQAVAVNPAKVYSPNMHQSSSRLLRMTQDDRPFTRDFKDLFSTLMVSLPLTQHRLRFKTYLFTFTSDQAVNNLGSLKFSQSNRMPDPKDPSRIVTTTTTTTFSMAKEMARTVCQKFVAARFMEAVGEKPSTPFTNKNLLWQLTPKGIHVLERFCQRNGINSPHIMALLASSLNTMRLVILERDPVTDKVSQDKSTTEIIFRRFAGTTPNIKPNATASDSDSVSEYGDGYTGVKLAETRKIYDKTVKYSFTGKSAVDWLLDCCTTIEPIETHEIAALFVRFGLVQCVVEDKIAIQQDSKVKEFQPTKSAIYIVTERGKRMAGWIDAERGSLENGKPKNGQANGSKSRREPGENRETNTTRLSCILADPALRLLFREFLRETLCEENLSFWLEVNDFHLQFNALNQKTLENIRETLAHAYGIYNAFLAPGSPCELNIDHTLRQDLAGRMTRAVAKEEQSMLVNLKEVATLFERAQEQVFKLMASDSVPKFARTARYIEMSGDNVSDDGSPTGTPPPQRQTK